MAEVDDVIELDPPGTRISFAQNGEDVRLWRAFEDVPTGFYVEVGGWDPEDLSISRSFYGRGWAGLVVEPLAANAEEYARRRPRDDVRCAAAGEVEGTTTLHVIPASTGWSTLDVEQAGLHSAAGFTVEAVTVPVVRLSDLLDESGPVEIHFMTIDVEGAERQVLAGLDLARHRPWVLIVEATVPNSREAAHQEWESGILNARYRLATFDGLNRFYVAEEHEDLIDGVALPPNVFDAYISRPEHVLRERVASLETRCESLSEEVAHAQEHAAAASREVHQLSGELEECRAGQDEMEATMSALSDRQNHLSRQLESVLNSRSWRLTRPLRMLRGGLLLNTGEGRPSMP